MKTIFDNYTYLYESPERRTSCFNKTLTKISFISKKEAIQLQEQSQNFLMFLQLLYFFSLKANNLYFSKLILSSGTSKKEIVHKVIIKWIFKYALATASLSNLYWILNSQFALIYNVINFYKNKKFNIQPNYYLSDLSKLFYMYLKFNIKNRANFKFQLASYRLKPRLKK